MKKILVLTLALSLIVAGIALATVVSTKHDMRPGSSPGTLATSKVAGSTTTQVCVFCHHPHRGVGGTQDALLWNISDAAQTYATYAKTSTITAVGIANPGDNVGVAVTNQASPFTLLCMGCHDGQDASNSFVAQPGDGTIGAMSGLDLAAAGGSLGTTLADDHPVDFVYPTTNAGDLKISTTAAGPTSVAIAGNITTALYPLFGDASPGNYTMQCATCHDVHNGTQQGLQFMRDKDAAGAAVAGGVIQQSRICRDCHTAK